MIETPSPAHSRRTHRAGIRGFYDFDAVFLQIQVRFTLFLSRTPSCLHILRRPPPLSHIGNGLPRLTLAWRVTRVLASRFSVPGYGRLPELLTVG